MNERDMTYFLCLSETKSFSAAAKKLGISQPSVTYAIRRLEKELGAPLFLRDQSHRNVTLTDAGHLFYRFAKRTLADEKFLKAQIKHLSDSSITIGVPNMIASGYMSELYEAFDVKPFRGKIHYINDASTALLKLLRTGKINYALITSVKLIQERRLTAEMIGQKSFEVVVPEDHPLAQKKDVSLAEAAAYPFVLFSPASNHYAVFKALMTNHHLHPVIAHQNRDIAVLYEMIRKQIGIGFLADVSKSSRKENGVVYLPIRDEDVPKLLVNVVYTSDLSSGDGHQQIVNVLKQVFKKDEP